MKHISAVGLPAVRAMYVNTKLPSFCFISDCAVPSFAAASSRRNAHLGGGVHHIQAAPASWTTGRLAYFLGPASGGLHVLQTYQQMPFNANRRRAPGKVAYCN
jgi:hypothetical protein